MRRNTSNFIPPISSPVYKKGVKYYFNPKIEFILITSNTGDSNFNTFLYNVNNTDEQNRKHEVNKGNSEKYKSFTPGKEYRISEMCYGIQAPGHLVDSWHKSGIARLSPYPEEISTVEFIEEESKAKKKNSTKNENI